MQHILDYLGSLMIGGMVFLGLITYYAQINETHMTLMMSSIVQEQYSSMTEVLESDFRKVGYGVTDSVKIALADTSTMKFLCDIDASGGVDSVAYYLGTTPVSGGLTGRKTLYRRVNGQDAPVLTGVKSFFVRYYDAGGNKTTRLSQIRSFDVRMTVESVTIGDNIPSGVVWNRTFKPNNLR